MMNFIFSMEFHVWTHRGWGQHQAKFGRGRNFPNKIERIEDFCWKNRNPDSRSQVELLFPDGGSTCHPSRGKVEANNKDQIILYSLPYSLFHIWAISKSLLALYHYHRSHSAGLKSAVPSLRTPLFRRHTSVGFWKRRRGTQVEYQ